MAKQLKQFKFNRKESFPRAVKITAYGTLYCTQWVLHRVKDYGDQ